MICIIWVYDISPEKNANNVAQIEAELMKQYLFSRRWIDETIPCKLEAGLIKKSWLCSENVI